MTQKPHLLASAPIAIAAMAVLPATALAQEAPVIVLDTPTAAPATSAPTPTVVLPEPAPVEIVSPVEPVVEAPPQSEPPAVKTPVAPAQTATTRSAEEVTATPPVAEPSLPQIDRTETSPVAATDRIERTASAPVDPAPVPQPVEDESAAALLFALLALGGVGLAALLLFRLRRRRTVEPETIERPVVASTSPVDREPRVAALDRPLPRSEPVEPSRALGDDGAAVPLPAELPADPQERRRLLHRMIAARPDRANPFHSYKARAKRARLILQSIGTRFTRRKPTIDLSQYTNVWPELRGWRPATA